MPEPNLDGGAWDGLGGLTDTGEGQPPSSQSGPLAPQCEPAPLDCYQKCAEADKEQHKKCVELNKEYMALMKENGCPGTSCSTKPLHKSCKTPAKKKKKKATKKTKKRKKRKCSCSSRCSCG